MSSNKSKIRGIKGKYPQRSKIIIDDYNLEQVKH
jgi:hypothetical protein